jgi:hypothetical protein
MKVQSNENWVKNNNWATPKYLLDYIKKEFFKWNDYFDPYPYDPDYEIDWLTLNWGKYTFVNPPYTKGDKVKFVNKCYEEYKKWNVIALLIQAATETAIFHDIIFPNADVYLLEKRVKFMGVNTKWEYVTDRTGQSGSALCIFNIKEWTWKWISPLKVKESKKGLLRRFFTNTK